MAKRQELEDKYLGNSLYNGQKYRVYNGGILYDHHNDELFMNQAKSDRLVAWVKRPPAKKIRPTFNELEDLSNRFCDCVLGIVGGSHYNPDNRIYGYDSYSERINAHYNVFLHNIKFMDRSDIINLRSCIKNLIKNYNLKNLHEKRITKLIEYVNKYKDDPKRIQKISIHKARIEKLSTEQDGFRDYYNKLRVIYKKLGVRINGKKDKR